MFIMYWLYAFFPSRFKFSTKYLRGLLLLVMIAFSGCIRMYMNDVKNDKRFVGNYTSAQAYLVRLNEPLQKKPKSFKSTASEEKVLMEGKWLNTKGDIFIYFRQDSFLNNLNIGSQIIFSKKPQNIHSAGNPGEFDYATYCHRKGIFFQQFLSESDYVLLPTNNVSFWETTLNATRQKIIDLINKNISGEEEQAVAKALLIGYRNDLDKDILRAFANAGVIHIIAISGMHLILIGGIFIWIFSPLKRWKHGRIFHAILVIVVVWFFTFIAGAVPSITRAAIMFSVFLLATLINRKYAIYNSLAFSAFLLLLINPYSLWDAGFTLSYAAVLSIVLFYKFVFTAVHFHNKILRAIWNLLSMSISAQILTLPFVLFYFHRFPVLFLFANIVAVPLSTIILYMEILLLMVSAIHPVALFIGKITGLLIYFFDVMMKYMGNLKFATIDFADIDTIQMLLLIAAVLGIYCFVAFKHKTGLICMIVCFLGCIIIGASQFIRQKYQHKLVVYNTSKHYIIDVFKGHSYASFSDTILDKTSDEYNYTLKLAREKYHTYSKIYSREIHADFPEILYRGKHIFVLNDYSAHFLSAKQMPDVIIVAKNKYINFNDLKNRFPHSIFVFANENSMWKIAQWKKTCRDLHLHFHSIPDNGAFVMNL